uniref:type II secretion system minor pseudopilin GspK n=1 Tax=Thaumasiovibrio occultus TaxID=1891184 RepID=UPI000B35D23B|nr:type II secretion system minor pseudopilin GspK [Thaumasiovibrio occultus]
MKQQRGIALILVLGVLSIMMTITMSMGQRLNLIFYRTENQLFSQQSYWYALSVEELARVAIKQSIDDGDVVNLSQVWATPDQRYPLDDGVAVGQVYDYQACFNINALSSVVPDGNEPQRPALVRSFQVMLQEQGVDSFEAEVIADSTWEFVNPSTSVQSAFGEGDSSYEGRSPAYLPPNGWLADKTELRAVAGMTAEIYNDISHLVCALPTDGLQINVNTLYPSQAAVLVGVLQPSLSLGDAQKLIEGRPYDGWQSVESFFAEPELGQLPQEERERLAALLTVSSSFFQLDAEVEVDRNRLRVASLLYRDGEDNIKVVRRRFGGFSERISDGETEQ